MRENDPTTGTWARPAGTPRPLVLVAEDHWDARQLYREMLELRGFRVVVCADGTDAIEHAKTHVPSAVILDLVLPGVSGWAVAEGLRAEPATRAIPIFGITARSDRPAIEQALAAGCDRVFVKPIDHRDLVRHLRAVIRRASAGPR